MSDPFFKIIEDRAAAEDLDLPGILRRMQDPICVECHAQYKKKFPGKPFGIVCDGVYSEEDVQELHEANLGTEDEMSLEEVRELLDPVYWAAKFILLPDRFGEYQPFQARSYQEQMMRCTARRKVDRCGRGTGKSTLAVIEELLTCVTRKNYRTLVACPAKAQAEMWFNNINEQLKQSPALNDAVARQKQAPYYTIEFKNGSQLTIFTTGSTSGKESDTLRGQSPRRIRIDEQDLLNPGDYKAIMPLLRRFPDTEFHGSSTPTGKRETYWEMCTKYPDYKEFHFPASVLPDYDEEACRREARTEIVYEHEFLAEFGDLEHGVFKPAYVLRAKKQYLYSACKPVSGRFYFFGADWNGKGTGTRVRVVEYDPKTGVRRCVWAETILGTTTETMERIRDLNQFWEFDEMYFDRGYGHVQDELIKKMGAESNNPIDKKLTQIVSIDFGASLEINNLVPSRGFEYTKYIPEGQDESKRPTKPFVVEGAVMAFESNLVQFADNDTLLEEQLLGFRVKTWSQHGYANTYECKVGDHDLIAFMLAILASEMKYGLFKTKPVIKHSGPPVVALSGIGGVKVVNDPANPGTGAHTSNEVQKRIAGVPSRQPAPAHQPGQGAGNLQVHYAATYNGGSHDGQMLLVSQKRGPVSQTMNRHGIPSRTAGLMPNNHQLGGRNGTRR